MSLSSCQMPRPRQIGFGCLLLVCFLVISLTYYKSEIDITDFSDYLKRGNNSCVCPVEAQTQGSNPKRSPEQHVEAPTDGPKRIQDVQVDAEPDTLLLIWMWPFGYKFALTCDMFKYKGCRLTDDKSLYHEAHGVFIHHRDIHGNLENLPSEPRPWFQKWVWINMESPSNCAKLPGLDNLFNLTSCYRSDSDIPVPYGILVPQTSDVESFQLPTKDKLVCWIVSHWQKGLERIQYYNKLKEHIQIETYGKAFGKTVDVQNYDSILSSCKFYLSFENSQHKDYISEKVYKPMKLGTVPVVLGTSRENYEDHIPGDSFIHVDDFSSPKELAERLLHLGQNTTEYMRYFDWKKRYRIYKSQFGRDHACKACRYLQKNRGYHASHSLTKWFWDQ
ncbi:4-galactosyl-N-acetylglucosaminide 3-alpha-L-fucosyltransferase 9-like isoform X1 [Hippoglossus stenolepis]|uniref:4-galactosyl-N-acetylglucosaminide 3-alpha-L-fucosyltransferase 9-like isoform X1 n=1 Tax=Hippoglossus stenolepis TaxID=195615 RepID=UPI00159C85F2|nr:4-galactosyl-N-acetylglucosaminide 3-alpha-L-fucosyltransferase 9-like isoform X1 [Hippoglossus stenolepis]XP_035003384.1 4-galactosyl-N-acetylglucosaminide 3-alpha-L-fucosyltransferase 9-like isoform X1 [Hippoglossus stenolepis]